MGKRLNLAGAIGVLFAALSVAPAAAADSLPANCEVGSVCIGEGSSISQSAELDKILTDTGVTVAVVRYEDDAVLKGNPLAAQIAQENGLSELILVEDLSSQDRFGAYSESGHTDEILTALTGSGQTDGGEAIVAADIGSIYDTVSVGNRTEAGGGFPILAVVLPAVAVIALVGTGVGILKRRSRKSARSADQPSAASIREEISEDLRRELNSLSATAESYGKASSRELQEASKLLGAIHGHIYELFKRIDKKKSQQNREIAQVRYLDTARKLNSTLSKDYFEDIVRNPALWDKASEKVAAVLSALESVDRQVIENIKQVNSSKALEFRVAVDSLIGTEAIDVEEAFGKEEGTGDLKITDPFRR